MLAKLIGIKSINVYQLIRLVRVVESVDRVMRIQLAFEKIDFKRNDLHKHYFFAHHLVEMLNLIYYVYLGTDEEIIRIENNQFKPTDLENLSYFDKLVKLANYIINYLIGDDEKAYFSKGLFMFYQFDKNYKINRSLTMMSNKDYFTS